MEETLCGLDYKFAWFSGYGVFCHVSSCNGTNELDLFFFLPYKKIRISPSLWFFYYNTNRAFTLKYWPILQEEKHNTTAKSGMFSESVTGSLKKISHDDP